MKKTGFFFQRIAFSLLLVWLTTQGALAQITERVADADDSTSVSYELREVTVESERKTRYSRKENPAVELMRRVIAAKKRYDLKQHDYYQHTNYQKITFGLNDLTPDLIMSDEFRKRQWLLNQIEVCQHNNKLILPLSVEEKVTQKLYSKEPHAEKTIINGETRSGVNNMFRTGGSLNQLLADCFTEVDLYEDDIRLFQYPFTSPIGRDAIAFYRFYLTDTTYVGRDLCYQVDFTPNNQQDFGFRGQLWVLADSSYQVKRCEMTLPKASGVNWVENLKSVQEYEQLPTGEWVPTVDDMLVEIFLVKSLSRFIVLRTTRHSNYDFGAIPRKLLRGKKTTLKDNNAEVRDEAFWSQFRQVKLTRGERSMDSFVRNLERVKGFKSLVFGLRALLENYVETGTKRNPSRVDIGPVNTIISQNPYDTWRLRASAQTTANLHPHLFLKGYYARGMKSKENYYDAQLTYTFNRPRYLPNEFPKKAITVESMRDVMLPSDMLVPTDKDNLFASWKFASQDKMFLFNRQTVALDYETGWGFSFYGSMKAEKVTILYPLSTLHHPLSTLPNPPSTIHYPPSTIHHPLSTIHQTSTSFGVRLAPGETYIDTKEQRMPLNLDAPVIRLQHTIGYDGVLGGQYSYHMTEGEIYRRCWMPMNWGKLEVRVKMGAQWSQVPYPLLLMPAANLSYILEDGTFNLINNMEFLNDRYLSAMADWDLNGKLFNRIPLLRRLKWREALGVKMLWGRLTDKNNPLLPENIDNQKLMPLPEGSYVMDGQRPYWEVSVGIHNILKLLHVDYIRRLSYNELPTAHKQMVKFTVRVGF